MFFMGSKIPSRPPISHLERCPPSTENQALSAKPLSGRAETQKRYAEKKQGWRLNGKGGVDFRGLKNWIHESCLFLFLESHWGESEGSMCCERNDADVWKKWDINFKLWTDWEGWVSKACLFSKMSIHDITVDRCGSEHLTCFVQPLLSDTTQVMSTSLFSRRDKASFLMGVFEWYLSQVWWYFELPI